MIEIQTEESWAGGKVGGGFGVILQLKIKLILVLQTVTTFSATKCQ
jgi:hypothetical protein